MSTGRNRCDAPRICGLGCTIGQHPFSAARLWILLTNSVIISFLAYLPRNPARGEKPVMARCSLTPSHAIPQELGLSGAGRCRLLASWQNVLFVLQSWLQLSWHSKGSRYGFPIAPEWLLISSRPPPRVYCRRPTTRCRPTETPYFGSTCSLNAPRFQPIFAIQTNRCCSALRQHRLLGLLPHIAVIRCERHLLTTKSLLIRHIFGTGMVTTFICILCFRTCRFKIFIELTRCY